ncbi:MAG: endolytic transglycosylase MltG [Desulfosarcinaceae bacterium]|nr:endolytic transglycosylase MltG [Desulfosarcinaceae bacterium]
MVKRALLRTLVASLVLIFLAAAGVAYFWTDLQRYARTPISADTTPRAVRIPPGTGFQAACDLLVEQGLVRHPRRFKLLARLRGLDKQLKAGNYRIAPNQSPEALLAVLVSGREHLHRLTIPEGYTLKQIADAVAAAGFGDADGFLEMVSDPKVVKSFGLSAETLEGYLFPDTYLFPEEADHGVIATSMVKRFRDQFSAEWRERAEALKMSVHEVVTLASIIEKETGDPAERPLISSVFHNRLKRGMRLETDPTVIYGIKDFDGNLTRKHLRTRTPYNTYKIKGLPPGPIASPGAKAIEAALYPAQSDYLYFVSRKDTTHQFSTNINDHNKAVRKYQLRRKSK